MWEGDEGEEGTNDEEDDQGLSKKELVDGLIAAVRPPFSTRSRLTR
jgi:hypothetical protein